jgi:hypothetical protein
MDDKQNFYTCNPTEPGMILITSGAYVTSELTAELGKLPPTFLPVGNRRLFELQIRELSRFGEPAYLSLPEDFPLSPFDQRALDEAGVHILRVPTGLTLAESILLCLNLAGRQAEPLRILHGDTLIYDVPDTLDSVSIGATGSYYPWAEYRIEHSGCTEFFEGLPNGGFTRDVLSGYFAFSDQPLFIGALARSRDNFIAALNAYAAKTPLTPLRTGAWHDFGHAHNYYTSKHHITTQRAFNTLKITERTVVKSGYNTKKIRAEAAWFAHLPAALKLYAPRMVSVPHGETDASYEIERLYMSTLSELYVFGKLPVFVWERIFRACAQFLDACATLSRPAGPIAHSIYLDKTRVRLEDFARQSGTDIQKPWSVNGMLVPGLLEMAESTAELIPKAERLAHIHGDLCFSNILYDFRTDMIQVIDPRGIDSTGAVTSMGDLRYDVSKLRHSVIGLYDFIKADRFRLRRPDAATLELDFALSGDERRIMDAFGAMHFGGADVYSPEIQAIMIHLFLSMLPLHADRPEHQMAFVANAALHFRHLKDGGRVSTLQPTADRHDRHPHGRPKQSLRPGRVQPAQVHA